MFARKATFWAFDRARSIARVEPVHSNDNLGHRMTGAPHAPALLCHWHIAPATGKPECHWEASLVAAARKPRQPRSVRPGRCVHAPRKDVMTLVSDATANGNASTRRASSGSADPD